MELELMFFSDEKMVTEEISEEDINFIMSGALEGGIGHWAVLDNTTEVWSNRTNEFASDYATKVLLDGGELKFFDAEDSSEVWYLTLEKLLKGIEINSKERPHDSDLELGDAVTYDCIIQYALFNKIVYG